MVRRISGQEDTAGHLKRLGDAVRAARNARGLSQEELADAAGIDRSHLGKIERGERNVTLLNVIRIATALNGSAAGLLSEAGL
ncbi:helix-turn-helix domain-containing protein [Sphingosinithalassobacter sp. LHW66-3]|uniref:helix-turn-helix domain-containing protein n=1 Tax=Sphingosinithalassobacter sp. LHW66-3 TaxID=3424718 RepID=UPI003D6BB146